MNIRPTLFISLTALSLLACTPGKSSETASTAQPSQMNNGKTSEPLEAEVQEYIKKFPYQDTFEYVKRYTGGDANKINTWIVGAEPVLVKAGEDKINRMNNDTIYKMAFVSLEDGPVVISSSAPTKDRFNSFQLMDDHNVNYMNIYHPAGEYTLYYGQKPENIRGEAIEVPSTLSVFIVRVEVKDKHNPQDMAGAVENFNGITIEGKQPTALPSVDLLSGFSEEVANEAHRRMDEAFKNTPFSKTVVGPDMELGRDVPYLAHSAGSKLGWGGPDTSHSTYETLFFDADGADLDGKNGTYVVTTEEPEVDAFWSLTVYDTERGGFFHPNKDDRYHINNTTAIKNKNGTFSFMFQQSCTAEDTNCLEVPAGKFDIVVRYYLPSMEIQTGEWVLPGISLKK